MVFAIIYIMTWIRFRHGLDYVHKRIYYHFRRIEGVYSVTGLAGNAPDAYYMAFVWIRNILVFCRGIPCKADEKPALSFIQVEKFS